MLGDSSTSKVDTKLRDKLKPAKFVGLLSKEALPENYRTQSSPRAKSKHSLQ